MLLQLLMMLKVRRLIAVVTAFVFLAVLFYLLQSRHFFTTSSKAFSVADANVQGRWQQSSFGHADMVDEIVSFDIDRSCAPRSRRRHTISIFRNAIFLKRILT